MHNLIHNKNKKDFNLFIFFSIYYFFIIYSGKPGGSNSGKRPLEIRLRQPSPRLYDMLYDRPKVGGQQSSSSSSSSSLISSIALALVVDLVSGAGVTGATGAGALAVSLSPR